VLQGQPESDVVLTVASDDDAVAIVIDPFPGTLRFTNANWSTPQTVTIDGLLPGQASIIVAVDDANSDAAFADVPNQSVSVTVSPLESEAQEMDTPAESLQH
jgi:hypothetical protein